MNPEGIVRHYTPPKSFRVKGSRGEAPLFADTDHSCLAVMGPRGSGKSSGWTNRCRWQMENQKPGRGGIRYSRGCVVRSTYSLLETTTMKTWTNWIRPEEYRAPIRYGMPHTHHLRFNDVDCEVMFLALDRPDDVKKLQSLEFSWIWFNEAAEQTTQDHFDMSFASLRFPPMSEGGPTAPLVMLDYNACDTEHWLYRLFEEKSVPSYRLVKQPPAVLQDDTGPIVSLEGTRYRVNPEADNLDGVGEQYYINAANGKRDAWIKVFLGNEYGFIEQGKAVYTNYADSVHYAGTDLPVYTGLPILVGVDFGNTPVIIVAQQVPGSGQLRILDEILPDFERGSNIRELVRTRFKPWLANNAPNSRVIGWGDPSGVKRNESDGRTAYMELKDLGFSDIKPAPFPKENFTARRLAVDGYLSRLISGKPAILLSRRVRMLRAGFLGRYVYATNSDAVVDNNYTHGHDGLQYLCLGLDKQRAGGAEMAARYSGIERYNDSLQKYVS